MPADGREPFEGAGDRCAGAVDGVWRGLSRIRIPRASQPRHFADSDVAMGLFPDCEDRKGLLGFWLLCTCPALGDVVISRVQAWSFFLSRFAFDSFYNVQLSTLSALSANLPHTTSRPVTGTGVAMVGRPESYFRLWSRSSLSRTFIDDRASSILLLASSICAPLPA